MVKNGQNVRPPTNREMLWNNRENIAPGNIQNPP